MQNVKIIFQNPFEARERDVNFINKEQTIKDFLLINWEQLNIDIYERHDDVIHDYYFFDISYIDNSNLKHALNISGTYTFGDALIKEGPQFQISYSRLIEKTKRSFLGFGASKTVTILSALEMEECNKSFAIDCLRAFINGDTIYLEKNIINNIKHTFSD